MNKLVASMAAIVALTGSAVAADLPARTYTKAPIVAPAPVYNWTGFYVGGGIGYSFLNNDHIESALGGGAFSQEATSGARGWLGTVQVGVDYQVSPNFVLGAFADYSWSDINGNNTLSTPANFIGEQKLDNSWAAGARLGYVVVPQFMAFVSGGYTQADFEGSTYALNTVPAVAPTFSIGSQTRDGWFIGTGYETQIGFLPGFTWKTEYRFSDFGDKTQTVLNFPAGTPAFLTTEEVTTHTIRSTLNYRFNWMR